MAGDAQNRYGRRSRRHGLETLSRWSTGGGPDGMAWKR
jgi:hypothetical protein